MRQKIYLIKYVQSGDKSLRPKLKSREPPPFHTMAPTPRRELTAHEKGMIEAYRNMGCSISQIAHVTNRKSGTIKSFLQRLKKRGSWENIRRVGRPRKSSITDDRLLVRKAQVLSHIPLKQLRAEANTSLSVATIRRRLAENNIRKWRAAQRPRLNKGHVEKRLRWAKEHLQWTEADWRKIGWSDECSIEKSADPRQVWVSRHPGEKEKYLPKNVVPKDKSGGVTLMVWGCFIGDMKSPLVALRGKHTADAYVTVLCETLVPFIQTLPPDLQRDFIYQ
jgi:transposase